MQLTSWQKLRMRAYLFAVGLRRRMTLGVRIVLLDGDRVFLVRHGYVPGWHLPGGGVEPGETAATAAARELSEETGFAATSPMLLLGLYHHSSAVTDRDHVAVFVCRDFTVQRPFRTGYEIADGGWFPIAALPPETAEASARRVAEAIGMRAPDPHW